MLVLDVLGDVEAVAKRLYIENKPLAYVLPWHKAIEYAALQ
jgi:hypothetical protein